MNDMISAATGEASPVRLETLIRLRWLAVAGQTAAVLIVGLLLQFPTPIGLCFVLIGISGWLNLLLRFRFPASFRLQPRWAALLLAYDALQLGGLLFLTGGLENPFAILLLVPVTISAASLAARQTVMLSLLVLAIATALSAFYFPLPWYPDMPLSLAEVYVTGVWVALVSALLFTGIYTFRVAAEGRQLAAALTATELILAREQHLSALDGLAAAAAHELGTPLATIALVAKELERALPPGNPNMEDLALLRSQTQRCREILSKLTSLSAQTDWHHSRLSLPNLLAEAAEPYREFGITIGLESKGEGPEPVGRRNPAILYGVGNLVENAVDFASESVTVKASWTAGEIVVTIADDGPGFAPEIIDRLGEPYFTTRANGNDLELDADAGAGGLGLGFFIAKTLLERSGAKLKLSNRELPEKGALVEIRWPRGEPFKAGRAWADA